MKLLLTSAGIRTQEIADKLAELTGKDHSYINIAIINEASAVETGDKTWLVNELSDLKRYIGGSIDFINLLALPLSEVEARVKFADAIYVLGGNPDYLYQVFQKTGFAHLLLEKSLDDKVYVGSSAGSMILTKRAKSQTYLDMYEKEKTFGIQEYFGIVPIIFRPHMESSDLPKYNYDKLREVSSDLDCDLYALKDSQAICVADDAMSFVGGDIFTLRV